MYRFTFIHVYVQTYVYLLQQANFFFSNLYVQCRARNQNPAMKSHALPREPARHLQQANSLWSWQRAKTVSEQKRYFSEGGNRRFWWKTNPYPFLKADLISFFHILRNSKEPKGRHSVPSIWLDSKPICWPMSSASASVPLISIRHKETMIFTQQEIHWPRSSWAKPCCPRPKDNLYFDNLASQLEHTS